MADCEKMALRKETFVSWANVLQAIRDSHDLRAYLCRELGLCEANSIDAVNHALDAKGWETPGGAARRVAGELACRSEELESARERVIEAARIARNQHLDNLDEYYRTDGGYGFTCAYGSRIAAGIYAEDIDVWRAVDALQKAEGKGESDA